MLKLVVVTLVVCMMTSPVLARGGGGRGGGHSSGTYSGTGSNSSSHYTSGHTNRNGTYVAPHYQTNPNGTMRDNYGARGNVNPYTGAVGTRRVPY